MQRALEPFSAWMPIGLRFQKRQGKLLLAAVASDHGLAEGLKDGFVSVLKAAGANMVRWFARRIVGIELQHDVACWRADKAVAGALLFHAVCLSHCSLHPVQPVQNVGLQQLGVDQFAQGVVCGLRKFRVRRVFRIASEDGAKALDCCPRIRHGAKRVAHHVNRLADLLKVKEGKGQDVCS